MKKIYIYLLLSVFIAFSAFAGEFIIGGGYLQVGGGISAEYAMNATDCSLSAVGLSGETFTYAGTDRTYIDCDGVMQTAGANTPRVESDGLLLEPAGANVCLQSRNFDTTPWAAVGTVNLAQNQTGVDGSANSAWIFDDDDSGSQEGIYYTMTISSSTRSYTASLFVKKTTSASSFPGIGLVIQGSSTSVGQVIVNTDNGTLTDRTGNPPDDKDIESAGDFWHVWITQADNDSGNNTLRLWIFAAVNTDGSGDWLGPPEGSVVVDAVQLEYDKPYPSSYIDNDGVAEGAEQSSGTLTIGNSYRITATEVDYFYTGCAVNDYFIAIATTSLDSNNKVTEFGTARATEAAALTYDLPSDLFAETLGSEEYTVVLENRVGLQGFEIYTTNGLDITVASNTSSTGTCYYNGNLDPDTLYKTDFDYVLNSGENPWFRFSSSLALNLDLTINVRMTGTGSYVFYAMGADYYGFTSGVTIGNWSMSNLSIKPVTNAHETGFGGTAIVWLKPGSDYTDHAAGVLTSLAMPLSLFGSSATNNILSSDGTTNAFGTYAYSKGDDFKIAGKWGYLLSNVAKHAIAIDSGGGLGSWIAADYDGVIQSGGNLAIGGVLQIPIHIKRIWIYKQTLTDVEINATPAP